MDCVGRFGTLTSIMSGIRVNFLDESDVLKLILERESCENNALYHFFDSPAIPDDDVEFFRQALQSTQDEVSELIQSKVSCVKNWLDTHDQVKALLRVIPGELQYDLKIYCRLFSSFFGEQFSGIKSLFGTFILPLILVGFLTLALWAT